MKKESIFIFFILITFTAYTKADELCDDELMIIKNSIGYYHSHSFNPFNPATVNADLNKLTGAIKAAFQLCLNKPWIINPYSPASDNCLIGLRKTSMLSEEYSKRIPSINDINNLSDVAIQAQTDCNDIINVKPIPYEKITDSCKKNIKEFNEILTKFTDDRVIGKSGSNYLSEIALYLEKQKRICDFDSVVKAKTENKDNCENSTDFFETVAELLERIIDKEDYSLYTSLFKLTYQIVLRATRLCNSEIDESKLIELKFLK